MIMNPIVYLLCGLPYSGKTTYARKLEQDGVVRLSLDEEVFRMFGRTYENHEEKQEEARQSLLRQLDEYLRSGTSVVLDWGFWKKRDRDDIQRLIREAGGEPRLLYFKRDIAELKSRANNRDMTVNHEIDEPLLDVFVAQFEEPSGEGEILV
jgi:predicted kinase